MPSETSTTNSPSEAAARQRESQISGIKTWVKLKRNGVARILTAIMISLGAIVAHLELDRLIAGALSPDGRSAPLGGLIGPLGLTVAPDAREVWSDASQGSAIASWIAMAVLVDGALILAYYLLFKRATRLCANPQPRTIHLRVLLVAEGVEALLLLSISLLLWIDRDIPLWLAYVVASIATIKWLLFVTLAIALLADHQLYDKLTRTMKHVLQAAWLHRLTAVLVVALFVLTCIPADGVLDQLPDLQRQWSDGGHGGAIISAFLVVGIAMLAAFVFGRMRARAPIQLLHDAEQRRNVASPLPGFKVQADEVYVYPNPMSRAQANERPIRFRLHPIDWWWSAPLAALLATLFAAVISIAINSMVTREPFVWHGVGWVNLAIFLAIPAIVVIVSAFLPAKAPNRWRAAAETVTRAQYGWLTGDLIAVLIMSVAGLGLVRSFTGPVAAMLASDLGSSSSLGGAVVLLVVGAVAVISAPQLLRVDWASTSELLNPLIDLTANNGARRHQAILAGIFGLGIVLLLAIAIAPLPVTELLGAPALTVALLALWGAVLGSFTIALQDHPPLPIFVRLRLRATPVLTLALTIPLLASIIVASFGADDPKLHALREMTGGTASVFPAADQSAEKLIDTRLLAISQAGCTLQVTGGGTARPVLVVAAEGGGIRAAYWTARFYEALQENNPCLARSVLLSSGVSGGSVGMAITAALEQSEQSEQSEQTDAADVTTQECTPTERAAGTTEAQCLMGRLSTPEAVGVGTAGLLARDQISGISGIRLPVVPMGEEAAPNSAQDRATLIERSWIDDVAELAQAPAWSQSVAIGIPVFNATDARTKCKVLITPLPMNEARNSDDDGRWDCSSPDGNPSVLPVNRACFEHLDWAGVAMLSARFPTITPAGRIEESDSCGEEDLQLVDGGYAEGSALGTVADLAPLITKRIAHFNAESADTKQPLLVPILIYVKNSAGYDLRTDVAKVSAEPLVPIVGYSAESKQMTAAVLMQRISETFRQTGGPDLSVAAIEGKLPGLAVTVAPHTVPTIVPPLGWALSSFSRESLDDALDGQLTAAKEGAAPTLKTLIDVVKAE